MLFSRIERAGTAYAASSTRYPHTVAGLSASGVIGTADIACQTLFQRKEGGGLDWRRTLGLTIFGGWHYGGPAKLFYLSYDKIFGVAPHLRVAAMKMVVDVYGHTPFILIPSFYIITGAFKGQTLEQSVAQLRVEWWEASFGSALFWTPICLANFRFTPQHSRILTVSCASFLHKTWFSYLSNRAAHQATQAR